MRTGPLPIVAGILLLATTVVHAQKSDTLGPLALARHRVESADYRLTGRLVRVDGNGKRTSYAVAVKAHWFPGELRMLVEVGSPAEARVHVLLEMKPGEKTTILVAHPRETGGTALPFEKWNEGPLGEGFSYEDFLEAAYFWVGQAAMGEARYGARSCDLVKSTPGPADETHYAEVKSWLDHSSGFPVHVEKTLKGVGNVKEFNYFGLRQTEGVWSASQVEAKVRGKAGSMLLIIDHGSPKAHLDLKDFSSAQFTHF